MNYVIKLSDIPKTAHYVIIKMDSVFIPGDERSRQAPGHGYPEHTKYFPEMRVTTNKANWEQEVAEELAKDPKQEKFVAYFVPRVAEVTMEVKVKVE